MTQSAQEIDLTLFSEELQRVSVVASDFSDLVVSILNRASARSDMPKWLMDDLLVLYEESLVIPLVLEQGAVLFAEYQSQQQASTEVPQEST